jgi:hypothetical protein
VEYISAVVVAVLFSLALYFMLQFANLEGGPEMGFKGGESESEPRPAPGDHVEKAA